jgi:hypothetical protein
MTRARFLAAYRAELERPEADVEFAMTAAKLRLSRDQGGWSPTRRPCAQRAWSAISGEGRVTLAKLRELPS